uniref:F-box domain-containing protein n=1 Tax=Clastoptera arizonana TaxID=38151 RepID=A0A1B6CBR3_9HEMI
MANVFSLPNELVLKIFSYLDVADISLSVSRVCKLWNILSFDKLLWKSLRLTVHKGMELDYVLSLLPHLPLLKRLTLQWRTDTDCIINSICEYCCDVVEIEMVCCGYVGLNCVQNLSACFKVTNFSIGKCWGTPNKCLNDVQYLEYLTSLNVSHSTLDSKQLRNISDKCTKLENLNIDYVKGISEDDIMYFINPRKIFLKSIILFGDLLSDSIFDSLKDCIVLKLLHISSCRKMSNKCFASIVKFKSLRSLTLRKCTNFTSKALWSFFFESNIVSSLTYLYISSKRIVHHEDVYLWFEDSSHVYNPYLNHFCICILTLDSFNIKKL